ncbi:MAG: hypothetical protein K1X28_00010 [Parachlamydiales bacterium]|nr:hypothetical protein [Parachlamydiales bacterium]
MNSLQPNASFILPPPEVLLGPYQGYYHPVRDKFPIDYIKDLEQDSSNKMVILPSIAQAGSVQSTYQSVNGRFLAIFKDRTGSPCMKSFEVKWDQNRLVYVSGKTKSDSLEALLKFFNADAEPRVVMTSEDLLIQVQDKRWFRENSEKISLEQFPTLKHFAISKNSNPQFPYKMLFKLQYPDRILVFPFKIEENKLMFELLSRSFSLVDFLNEWHLTTGIYE